MPPFAESTGDVEKDDVERVASPNPRRNLQRSSSTRQRRLKVAGPLALVLVASIFFLHARGGETWERFRVGAPEEAEGAIEEVRGTPQEVLAWTEEEEVLRAYSWGPVEPHKSLRKVLWNLTDDEQRVRSWLLETRPLSGAGTGVGLGSSSPPQDIRPAPRAARHRELPAAGEGPGEFVGGSISKYAELLEEWKTGEQASACGKGAWEDEYTTLHREIMSGERPAKVLEYDCFEGALCGGLADRMLGIMSTFVYAIMSGRAFVVRFEHPVPFDLLFDSPHVNWARNYSANSTLPTTGIYSNTTMLANRKETLSAINWEPWYIDNTFPGYFSRWSSAAAPPWISILFNRGLVLRNFFYPAVRPRLEELGLVYSTAYTCLMNYLVRPKAPVLEFINEYTSLFSLPSVFAIGIQIRTGDEAMFSPEVDLKNTVERHANYFRCADQVARAYAHKNQRIVYYLISDSMHLKHDALRAFPDKVVISGLESVHPEMYEDGVTDQANGMQNAIAEQYALSGTDFQILTKHSGFGKMATWLRGRPGSTIQVQNPYLPWAAPPEPYLDCGVDSAIDGFAQLSSTWSLG